MTTPYVVSTNLVDMDIRLDQSDINEPVNFSFVVLVDPFVLNAFFLPLLKTSEKGKIFCFQGVEKWCSGNEWVKDVSYHD